MSIETTRVDGKDLLQQVWTPDNQKLGYENAKRNEMTFSQWLEKLSPTPAGEKLDAYERLMKHCGIITKDDPAHGIYASKGDLFFSSNVPESRILFPEYIERTLRAAKIARGDFLSYLIAGWEYSTTGLFRAPYFDMTAAQRQMAKKGAGTKPKKIKCSWSEKPVVCENFACELEMSYEFVRAASLPVIAKALDQVAQQQNIDECALAIYTMINGDGTTKEYAAAANTNLSSYQTSSHSATADLLYVNYLKWLATFYPNKATTLVASMSDIVDLICMAKPSTDPILMYELLNKNLTGGIPTIVENPFGQLAFIPSPDTDVLTSNTLLAVDKTQALMGYRILGNNLVETDRLIRGQFEVIVISNSLTFASIFTTAAKKMTCSA